MISAICRSSLLQQVQRKKSSKIKYYFIGIWWFTQAGTFFTDQFISDKFRWWWCFCQLLVLAPHQSSLWLAEDTKLPVETLLRSRWSWLPQPFIEGKPPWLFWICDLTYFSWKISNLNFSVLCCHTSAHAEESWLWGECHLFPCSPAPHKIPLPGKMVDLNIIWNIQTFSSTFS